MLRFNGEMTVKRLSKVYGQITLTADNQYYPDVKVGDFEDSKFGEWSHRDLPVVKVVKGSLKI